jgi:PTS system N-acetylglucosamine-specific IIC component
MIFARMQQLGRSLMLPIAVLPIAGLLLRLGQDDLLNNKVLAEGGNAIFANLALIFAIGVAVGFAKDNAGVAGLAGGMGYVVMKAVMTAIDAKLDAGVLAGILAGLVAGALYNRFKDIRLPSYLAFFGGKRFVPIVTGVACLLLGVMMGYAWPPVQAGIDGTGHWLIGAGWLGLFVYGVLNRLLLVTGLHHILNSLVWFVFGSYTDAHGAVVAGDLHRFFAGDPHAGAFMTGFFPVMMFGLPAACLAMYRAAPRANRRAVGGMLLSMALTSLLTGVTEPIEFAFMFIAPVLYAVHAVLTGLALAVMDALHIRLGFTFSGGAIDYVLSFGKSTNGLLMLPIGVAYFIVYYFVFTAAIRFWKLATPGREAAEVIAVATADRSSAGDRARAFIDALGGAENLLSVDACTTRLRLAVARNAAINEPALRALGAKGVVKPAAGSVQVVLGPEADLVADTIRAALAQRGKAGAPSASSPATEVSYDRTAWLAGLGGPGNLRAIEAIAATRLRTELVDTGRIDEDALKQLGAVGVMKFSTTLAHIILKTEASDLATVLQE